MQTTPQPLTPYVYDLELISASSEGRRLMDHIRSLGLDDLGTKRPIDLAKSLQSETDEVDELVGRYLEAAITEKRLVSIAMVALAPALTEAIRSSVGFAVTTDYCDALQLALLELLRTATNEPPALRRKWLARTAAASARSATRSRNCTDSTSLPLDPALQIPISESDGPRTNARLNAMWEGICTVLSRQEFVLIDTTRVRDVELTWMAERFGVSYNTMRMRRSRAEARLRSFIEASGAGQ